MATQTGCMTRFLSNLSERFCAFEAAPVARTCVSWDSEPTRDNFFGGDLRGIGESIWILMRAGSRYVVSTPIFQTHTNHRYDAGDYFSIDRRLGNLDDFDALISLAHRRSILRVVLDGVFNHCGKDASVFPRRRRERGRSEYVDWFYVEDFSRTKRT